MDQGSGVMVKSPKKRKKKARLAPAQKAQLKLQSEHRSSIRQIFSGTGFRRVTGVSDKPFTFDGQTSDIDDLFIFENVIVVAEYTCTQSSEVGAHLKNKKLIFDKIIRNKLAFVRLLKTTFADIGTQLDTGYHASQIELRLVYCSRYRFDEHYQDNVPGPVYFDYPAVRYFQELVKAVKRSARFEFLDFLKVLPKSLGSGGTIQVSATSKEYQASLLPEAHSHFDDGYKIVTFYAHPDWLLKTAYVLRKDGWRDSLNLYQRMISRNKIESIRSYLRKQKRVFLNNIIVTLPSDVKPLDSNGDTVDTSSLTETVPVIIKLPDRPNTIGMIDGQHRVFAYHETHNDDTEIAKLRGQQNLLVTGIIYPDDVSKIEKEKFEARLFLEINSTQTSARPEIKQAIGLVLDPFSYESIATKVLNELARTGPLSGFIEEHFYEKNKLKTASIISYGLKPLVKTTGEDSVFAIWTHPRKQEVASGTDGAALEDYINFCVTTINSILGAIKANVKGKWTTDTKIPNRLISTTYVNSFLIVARLLILNNKPIDYAGLARALSGLDGFDFSAYRSSQYKRLADKIVEIYF